MWFAAATFGWLCVETFFCGILFGTSYAATFGWLCVETLSNPVMGGRLLAATFGWLCVETVAYALYHAGIKQPPSGGCVLKQYNQKTLCF